MGFLFCLKQKKIIQERNRGNFVARVDDDDEQWLSVGERENNGNFHIQGLFHIGQ